MRTASLLLLILSVNAIFAQKHDYQWFLGHSGGSATPLNDRFGITQLDFNYLNHPLIVERQELDMGFFTANTSMCDSVGRLLFYSNGIKIYGPNHQLMDNGGNLLPSDGTGIRAPQAVLALPYPNNWKKYVLINQEELWIPADIIGWKLYCNTLNFESGTGLVTERLKPLVQDSMSWGKITAVKHGNGRDWWFIVPIKESNRHYLGLVTPNGIKIAKSEAAGSRIYDGLGQVVFTPNGKMYIKANDIDLTLNPKVEIYDFDRCSGRLSNQRTLVIEHEGFSLGLAVSPDSRYLYVTRTTIAYQYDLTAPDIAETQKVVAEWDGFVSNNNNSVFWLSQLAPDGRIYIGSLNSTFHLHYINFPNRSDTACQFVKHGIKLPVVNRYAIPNHPNYRLGPLDGSPCDTLGLDNHPLANFRWEQEDTLQPLRITFTDLSAYEPKSWHWTFGDGTNSVEPFPGHTYAAPGVYEVCLVVGNEYSADTFCQQLYLGVSAQDNPLMQGQVDCWPNPFYDQLAIGLSAPDWGSPVFRLHDAAGRELRTIGLSYGITELSLADLAPGFYVWEVWASNPGFPARRERIKTGKLVKVE